MRARVVDELTGWQAFVAAEVVSDDDIAGCQRRDEHCPIQAGKVEPLERHWSSDNGEGH